MPHRRGFPLSLPGRRLVWGDRPPPPQPRPRPQGFALLLWQLCEQSLQALANSKQEQPRTEFLTQRTRDKDLPNSQPWLAKRTFPPISSCFGKNLAKGKRKKRERERERESIWSSLFLKRRTFYLGVFCLAKPSKGPRNKRVVFFGVGKGLKRRGKRTI